MDNIRRQKLTNRRAASVDGFTVRTSERPALVGGNVHENNSGKRKRDKTLPGARDGFTPRRRLADGKLPDGTSLGRRPVFKEGIDLNIDTPKKRRKFLKKPDDWKRFAKRTLLGLCAFVLLVGLVLGGLAYWRARQVFRGGASALGLNCEVDPSRLKKEGDGRVNILMLGRGGLGHDGPDLTDTLLLASVDACQKDMGLLSIPRDLYVQNNDGAAMKINAIYATAKEQARAQGKTKQQAEDVGIKSIESVIENITGMPIHYYAMIDFGGFRKAIDTVGGVTINVKEPLYDPTVAWENNNNPLIADKGIQKFNGARALLYAKSRYGSARGDFDRAERQRQMLVALREKIFSVGTFGNPVKISNLINDFGHHARTNLSLNDIMKLYNLAKDIDGSKTKSLSLVDPPHELLTTSMIDGLSVVIPNAGLYNYGSIQHYARNALRDGFLRKEKPTIMVVNGTEIAGKAAKYANVLKSYGYKVSKVGDAPTHSYNHTTVVDLRSGSKKYTKRYLELRFKTAATSKLPKGINPGSADFVIIIGNNEPAI